MQLQTLFNICVDFVAHNVWNVESFNFMPEIIGKQIFMRCTELQESINTYSLASNTLKLFVSAYGSDLLTSLSLTNQKDILDKYSKEFDVLLNCEGLVSLDLGNCSLHDDHAILKVIAQKRLKNLGLSHNFLGTSGLRCLTTRVRMMKDGPVELTTLQLQGNLEINDSCVRYLLAFKHIKFLDLSDNFISHNGMRSLCNSLKLTTMTGDQKFVEINTCGWATSLIQTWLKKLPVSSSKAKKFYGSHQKRCQTKKSPVEISRKMQLISVNFNKNCGIKDSSSLTETKELCQQQPVKDIRAFEKRNLVMDNDDDEEENERQRKKKRKLNESSVSKIKYHDLSYTKECLMRTQKPKAKKIENIPISSRLKTIKDVNDGKNTLLSALDQIENESNDLRPCRVVDCSKISEHNSENYSDARSPTLNTMKPLPIKKIRLKKK